MLSLYVLNCASIILTPHQFLQQIVLATPNQLHNDSSLFQPLIFCSTKLALAHSVTDYCTDLTANMYSPLSSSWVSHSFQDHQWLLVSVDKFIYSLYVLFLIAITFIWFISLYFMARNDAHFIKQKSLHLFLY